jgi:hypothetical protein
LTEPETVFRRQVAAFNAHDLEAFLATYADDAVAGIAPAPVAGADALRAHYASRLGDASLGCDVVATTTFGSRWLVAHERVTSGTGAEEVVAVFEVTDGLIRRATMVRG